ncbi:MAG TPA: dUTP diphosphatase [Pseudogracilibacillus sp.]|nr:dUTP diphosphatase [Pseudogracilibacillus sp.]
MNWELLFNKQIKLDEYINANHELNEENLFDQKILALFVELGELANETRCFKFWSNKQRNSDQVIIEEYVDNIHFLLSLGLSKGLAFKEIHYEQTNVNETTQFNLIFQFIAAFKQSPTNDNYLNLFRAYLQLADILGFSNEAIMQAYNSKNDVNFKRQDQGY